MNSLVVLLAAALGTCCSGAPLDGKAKGQDVSDIVYQLSQLRNDVDDSVVLVKPPEMHMVSQPESMQVRAGEPVTLQCAAAGIPSPRISWMFNGRPIDMGGWSDADNFVEKLHNAGSPTIQNGVTGARLRLPCVDAASQGLYSCWADNGVQAIVSHARLTVRGGGRCPRPVTKSPPTIYMWSEGRFERADNAAQLYCRASGEPQPRIYWVTEDGQRISPSDDRFELLDSGDLLIKKAAAAAWEMSGEYTCIAENAHGVDKATSFYYATEPVAYDDVS